MGPKKSASQKDSVKGKMKQTVTTVDMSSSSESESEETFVQSGKAKKKSETEEGYLQLEKTMKKLFQDFKKEMKKEMRELQDSLNFNNGMLEDALKKIEDMSGRQDKIEEENKELKIKVRTLETSMDDLEQYTRNKNIQIDGVPPKVNENLKEMMVEIGKKIDVDIKNEDIDAIHRIPTRSTKVPEPIVVQFLTRQMREAVVQKAKSSKVCTKDLNIDGESKPIYVNEHLTRKKKHILFEARRIKFDKNYKFLWTKAGKIFIRKDERSTVINLNSIDDLQKIV